LLFRGKYFVTNACVPAMNQTDECVNKSIRGPLLHHLPQTAGKVNKH